MHDDECEDCEFEALAPLPFSWKGLGAEVCFALSGIFSCVSEFFSGTGQNFGHAASRETDRVLARDEGEKFARDVMRDVAGLDSLG